MGKKIVLILSAAEWQAVKAAVWDRDGEEALRLWKAMLKQVEQQEAKGLKSHLG
jgi:hypothetical protein